MFRSLFTHTVEMGFCSTDGTARRHALQMLGSPRALWAITAASVLALAALSGPATAQVVRDHRGGGGGGGGVVVTPTGGSGGGTAQPNANAATKPLRAFFTALYCTEQSNDNTWPNPDHDEPYLLIFTADLRQPSPKAKVFITPVYSDVDAGEKREGRVQFWPVEGGASPIGSDADYIVLVAVLESDDILNAGHIQRKLTSDLVSRLQPYMRVGWPKSVIAKTLREDMDRIIDAYRDDYGDEDDRVGATFELVWGSTVLKRAQSGQPTLRTPRTVGSGSGYNMHFLLE